MDRTNIFFPSNNGCYKTLHERPAADMMPIVLLGNQYTLVEMGDSVSSMQDRMSDYA